MSAPSPKSRTCFDSRVWYCSLEPVAVREAQRSKFVKTAREEKRDAKVKMKCSTLDIEVCGEAGKDVEEEARQYFFASVWQAETELLEGDVRGWGLDAGCVTTLSLEQFEHLERKHRSCLEAPSIRTNSSNREGGLGLESRNGKSNLTRRQRVIGNSV